MSSSSTRFCHQALAPSHSQLCERDLTTATSYYL